MTATLHRTHVIRPRRLQRWFIVWCESCPNWRQRAASADGAVHVAELHQQGTPDGDAA